MRKTFRSCGTQNCSDKNDAALKTVVGRLPRTPFFVWKIRERRPGNRFLQDVAILKSGGKTHRAETAEESPWGNAGRYEKNAGSVPCPSLIDKEKSASYHDGGFPFFVTRSSKCRKFYKTDQHLVARKQTKVEKPTVLQCRLRNSRGSAFS